MNKTDNFIYHRQNWQHQNQITLQDKVRNFDSVQNISTSEDRDTQQICLELIDSFYQLCYLGSSAI